MKKLLLMTLLLVGGSSVAYAAQPTLLFSDLTSGPKTGGQNDKGAFVTIVGRNFGASRGTSYVKVGAGQVDNYPVWSDTKIVFQLGANASTGDIIVVTAEGASNGIAFTVRNGNIYFVDDTSPNSPGTGTYSDPWRSPRNYFTAMQAGDICYFREGTYTGQYGSTSRAYNVSVYNQGAPSGSSGNEIAWVGYPGETALFKADSSAVYNGCFELRDGVEYYVIAGLSLYGRGDGREQVRLASGNNKLVNCKIEGIKTLSYGMIGVTASNLKIWGNEMFGAESGNKLDHIIYFQSGGQSDNVDVGWNYIHDNDIAVGPVFSWNLGSGTSNNVVIHDNKIDCRGSSDILRLAGIWSGSGGSITFANNLIIGAGGSLNGDNAYNAIYAAFGNITVYNNTFYLSKGAGSNYVINMYDSASASVKNNIFYNTNTISYVKGDAAVDSNLYYGGSGSVPTGDAHKITADPEFVNASGLDLHIAETSPAIDKGADTTAVVKTDYDGYARSAAAMDIGAYEYYTGQQPPPPPPSTVSISGSVKDAAGAGISGVAVILSGASSQEAVTDAAGNYTLSGLAQNSSFTLTPGKTGWSFSPESISVTAAAADVTGKNFTGAASVPGETTYYIKGYVKDSAGAGISGAAIALSGGASSTTLTAADGSYKFLALAKDKNYALTPAKTNYTFTPASYTVAGLNANVDNKNFTGQASAQPVESYYISGYVRDLRGHPEDGVSITLSGGESRSAVTANGGFYKFEGLAAGKKYTVTPSKQGWKIYPQSITVQSLDGNLINESFLGKRTFHIRGYVKDNKGRALRTVRMTIDGKDCRTLITDETGYYEFLDLEEDSTYKVTSEKEGYAFEPSWRSTGTLSGFIDAWDFEGIYISSVIRKSEMKALGSAAGRGVVNPDKGETARIYFKGTETGTFEVRIFTLSGELVWEHKAQNVQEGTFEWLPESIASGIYIAHVKGPGLDDRKKIAVIR